MKLADYLYIMLCAPVRCCQLQVRILATAIVKGLGPSKQHWVWMLVLWSLWSSWWDLWIKHCRAAGAQGLYVDTSDVQMPSHCQLCARMGGHFKAKCWAAWMNQHFSVWRCESLPKDTGLQTPDEWKLLLQASRVKYFYFLQLNSRNKSIEAAATQR